MNVVDYCLHILPCNSSNITSKYTVKNITKIVLYQKLTKTHIRQDCIDYYNSNCRYEISLRYLICYRRGRGNREQGTDGHFAYM